MLYWVHLARAGFKLTTLVVIGNDCIGSCKSNYHTITHDHDGHSCQYVNAPISKFWWTHLSNVAAKIYFPFGENLTNDTGGLSSSESEKK